ncbi:MAG: hypothetical protein JW750_00920 [Anaerolineaceae bacterium]|nr:hypothetical protein [Anaerolineaceae bacterium]
MKYTKSLTWLIPLITLLAVLTAAIGLFWQTTGEPFEFTTIHGQTAEIYGRGIYYYDTTMTGAGFRGADLITLLIAIPLLLVAFWHARRGTLRGKFLLLGALSYFLYNGASLSFAAAYNPLFLAYVALFSASLFALIIVFSSIDPQTLPAHVSERMPHGRIAAFLFFSGSVVLILWGMEIVSALLANEPPVLLLSYTTTVTHGIDMGIIAPSAFTAAVMLLKRDPTGYRVAFPLLLLNTLIGLVVVGQTVMQIRAGIEFHPGQLIGIVGSWVILAGLAGWNLISMYRNISKTVKA